MGRRIAWMGLWLTVLAVAGAALIYRMASLMRAEFHDPLLIVLPRLTLCVVAIVFAVAMLCHLPPNPPAGRG
jgi:hypothetical protein